MNYNTAKVSLLCMALITSTISWSMKRPSRPDNEYVFKKNVPNRKYVDNRNCESSNLGTHHKYTNYYCAVGTCNLLFKNRRTLKIHVEKEHGDSLKNS